MRTKQAGIIVLLVCCLFAGAHQENVVQNGKVTENSSSVTIVEKSDASERELVINGRSFKLNRNIQSVERAELSGNHLIVIGHVNPSMQIYQRFDSETGEEEQTLYGYGFTDADHKLIFVQSPQHFSGVSGHDRLVDSEGSVYYESPENVVILSDLSFDGKHILFGERNVVTNEETPNTVDISAPPIDGVKPYYE